MEISNKEQQELFKVITLIKPIRELYTNIEKVKIASNAFNLDILTDFNTNFINSFLIMAKYHKKLDFNTIKELLKNKQSSIDFEYLNIELILQPLTNQYIVKYYNKDAILDGITTYHYNKTIFDRFFAYYEDKFQNEKQELINNNKYIQDLIFSNQFEHIMAFYIFIIYLMD